jgi:hypothetical protein
MEPSEESLPPPTRPRSGEHGALAVEVLRIGLGLVWLANLVFIVDPANQFFPTFSSSAASYGPTTLGGPGLASFVAAHGGVFSVLLAVATAYLAFAFTTGTTTRWACVVGFVLSGFFLVTQWGSTFYFPGGTDVGPHPLYMLLAVGLFLAPAGRSLALDPYLLRHLGRGSRSRLVRLFNLGLPELRT